MLSGTAAGPLCQPLATAERRAAGRVTSHVFRRFLDGPVDYLVAEIAGGEPLVQPWHAHPGEQAVLPVRGELVLEWRDGDEAGRLVLRPGYEHRIPAGLTHRMTAYGGLVEVFAPCGTALCGDWTGDGR